MVVASAKGLSGFPEWLPEQEIGPEGTDALGPVEDQLQDGLFLLPEDLPPIAEYLIVAPLE